MLESNPFAYWFALLQCLLNLGQIIIHLRDSQRPANTEAVSQVSVRYITLFHHSLNSRPHMAMTTAANTFWPSLILND